MKCVGFSRHKAELIDQLIDKVNGIFRIFDKFTGIVRIWHNYEEKKLEGNFLLIAIKPPI